MGVRRRVWLRRGKMRVPVVNAGVHHGPGDPFSLSLEKSPDRDRLSGLESIIQHGPHLLIQKDAIHLLECCHFLEISSIELGKYEGVGIPGNFYFEGLKLFDQRGQGYVIRFRDDYLGHGADTPFFLRNFRRRTTLQEFIQFLWLGSELLINSMRDLPLQ